MSKFIIIATAFCLAFSLVNAQSDSGKNQFSIVSGLNQPIVFQGFNIEVNYWTKNWVFDYSHGFDLHVKGSMLGRAYEDQQVNFRIAHSFGAGVGYRLSKAFNVRLEPKIHIYETYYDGDDKIRGHSIKNFTTYTLGLGAYYRWLPFENRTGLLKGVTVVPSVRYWPKVASSLKDGEFSYANVRTGKNETLKAPNIGLANSPFLFNISIGYTF